MPDAACRCAWIVVGLTVRLTGMSGEVPVAVGVSGELIPMSVCLTERSIGMSGGVPVVWLGITDVLGPGLPLIGCLAVSIVLHGAFVSL